MTSHLNIGGVTTYVLTLAKTQRAQGHEVALVSGGGSCEAQARAAGVTCARLPLQTKAAYSPRVWWASRDLIARLRREPVEIIHAHTRVAQIVAQRVYRRTGIPFVTTWHGFYRLNLGRRLWPCTGRLAIAISEPVRRHLVEVFGVPASHVRLILNGVDVEHFASTPTPEAVAAFRTRVQLPATGPVIGGIGRLASGRVKGFDLLLEASRRVAETVPALHVLIVGDGPRYPFLQAKARTLGLEQRVHFVRSTDDVRPALALLEIFVFPVRWNEGFGLSLVEAMAAGRPVVATRVGAVPSIIEHGRHGWLVPPEDPVALSEAILNLLRDRELATRLGAAARERAAERFSLRQMATAVEAVYQEALATPVAG